MKTALQSLTQAQMLQKLDLPVAVLRQIQETRLCNEFVDRALEDLESLSASFSKKPSSQILL